MTLEDRLRQSLARQAATVTAPAHAWDRLQSDKSRPGSGLPFRVTIAAAVVVAVAAAGLVLANRHSPNVTVADQPNLPAFNPTAPPAAPASRARILISTPELRVLDVDSGASVPVPRASAPPAGAAYDILGVRGGFVVRRQSANGDVYFLGRDFDRPPVLLGRATSLVRSLHVGRVWLVAASGTITEVATSGAPTSLPQSLPCCGRPVADVDGGILLSGPDGLVVWSLTQHRARRTIPNGGFVAATARTLVWVRPACADAGGVLELTDLHTGTTRAARVDDGPNLCFYDQGSLSSDGLTVAVFRPADGAGSDLGLLDLGTARVQMVPVNPPMGTMYGVLHWGPQPGELVALDEIANRFRLFRRGHTDAPLVGRRIARSTE